jgi:hypothetical protein
MNAADPMKPHTSTKLSQPGAAFRNLKKKKFFDFLVMDFFRPE